MNIGSLYKLKTASMRWAKLDDPRKLFSRDQSMIPTSIMMGCLMCNTIFCLVDTFTHINEVWHKLISVRAGTVYFFKHEDDVWAEVVSVEDVPLFGYIKTVNIDCKLT